MKTNPAPFFFLPGTGLIGYFVAGWQGLGWALAAWLSIVVIGTAAHLIRRFNEQPPRGGKRAPDFVSRAPVLHRMAVASRAYGGVARVAAAPRPRN
jgi:hypothetical protein